MIAEAQRRTLEKEIRPVLPGRPYHASEAVKAMAIKTVGLEHEEQRRQRELGDAINYHASGQWQLDGVEVGKLDELIAQLRIAYNAVRMARFDKLDGLLWRISDEKRGEKVAVTFLCESVMQQARGEVKSPEAPAMSPLAEFRQREMRPIERSQDKAAERSHQR